MFVDAVIQLTRERGDSARSVTHKGKSRGSVRGYYQDRWDARRGRRWSRSGQQARAPCLDKARNR